MQALANALIPIREHTEHRSRSGDLPTGYNRMEDGWVVNHSCGMDKNGHPAGHDIVAKPGLKFAVVRKYFAGGSKS